MENLPEDVAIVMAYLWTKTPCGSDMYKRIQETVKKYPEYFPWETKYNSIDDSVHRAYENEKELLFKSFSRQHQWIFNQEKVFMLGQNVEVKK